ncbi:hypothetical protein M9H77_08514 [Catharanthus roseus]|uniref:Uncharacterized protein n=1 Tax=Catharanthus roseus TaxID=4058 RepID=A0ACC0BYA1_CATRO|nr:hypothetical protein M9H77_08514 [Catharanthus roseus]
MHNKGFSRNVDSNGNANEEDSTTVDLRRGPWTLEEDNLLIQYISCHGEGRWNKLAKCAGLKRTGKSCRLRWLNYLKPDIKRGNLTPQEQLLILELHSKWGNRWSKIAQHLPGRTDNEIKNYWRTRVQKQARQLNIDSNSRKFLEAIRRYWMPRLLEKVDQNSSLSSSSNSSSNNFSSNSSTENLDHFTAPAPSLLKTHQTSNLQSSISPNSIKFAETSQSLMTNSNMGSSNSPRKTQLTAEIVENQTTPVQTYGYNDANKVNSALIQEEEFSHYHPEMSELFESECQIEETDWFDDEISAATLWNMDEFWCFRKPAEAGI